MNKIKKILAATATLFMIGSAVGCNVKPLELVAPTIALNNNVVTWNAVDKAEGYIVSLNSEESQVTGTSYTINATEFGDYTVKVKAFAKDKETFVYSNYSNTVTYHKDLTLSAPVITLTGSKVTWPAVANASKYEVFVNGTSKGEQAELAYTINETAYGDYKVTVKAIGMDGSKKVTSAASNEVKYHVALVLDAPVIALNENVVSWNEVTNATKYEVFVNGTTKGEQTTCSYTINETEHGEYKVTVKAVAMDGQTKVASVASNEVRYVIGQKLAAPAISASNKVVSWSAVANAGSYDVYVNNVLKTNITETSYTLAETIVGSYEVEVVAKASSDLYFDSDRSNNVTITIEPTKLAAPAISINANVISWSAVENATSYDVYVNNAVAANITTTSYTISDIGNHTVEVVAKPTSSQYADSAKSNTITFNTTAEQLWLVGSSATISSGAEISGLNYAPSADSPLAPNQVVKIGYAMTIRNIATSGTIDFKPLIQRNVEGTFITIGETVVSYSYSDLYKIGGKVLVSFVIQLPSDFNKTTDYVVPRLWCNGEIDATLAGIFMHTNGFDYKVMNEWLFAGESVATTQTMAVTNGYMPSTAPAPYVPDTSVYGASSSSHQIQSDGEISGLNFWPSDPPVYHAGQVVKICYCINFTSLAETGTITFYPCQQRSTQGYASTGDTQIDINYSDLAVKSGKVVLSFVVQLSDQFDPTVDVIVPRLKFTGNITATLDWLYVLGDGYNCGAFPDGYAFGLEARATTSSMAVTNRYAPSVVA